MEGSIGRVMVERRGVQPRLSRCKRDVFATYSRPILANISGYCQVHFINLKCFKEIEHGGEKLSEESFYGVFSYSYARNLGDDVSVNLQKEVKESMDEKCCDHNKKQKTRHNISISRTPTVLSRYHIIPCLSNDHFLYTAVFGIVGDSATSTTTTFTFFTDSDGTRAIYYADWIGKRISQGSVAVSLLPAMNVG